MRAEDIGQFWPRWFHRWLEEDRGPTNPEDCRWNGRRHQRPVDSTPGLQVGVTEQDLDSAKIDAGFEKMCSEGMP